MEVLVVNSNLYVDPVLKELMIEEVAQINSVICVYGTEAVFNEIVNANPGRTTLHLGFSPLPSDRVSGFLSFYALYKGENSVANIATYDMEGIEKIELRLYKSLRCLHGKNKSYSRYTQGLDDINEFISSGSIPTYKEALDLLKYDIELDKLLLTIFNYQYLHCDYKNINKGLENSLNNVTVLNELYTLANTSFYKGLRWRALKDCLDSYVMYRNNSNERALILYVSLFSSMANFYKNILFSAHSYSFLLRCVEVLACFYLFKRTYISEHNGNMFDSYGDKIVGAGPLLNLLKGLGKIKEDSILFHLLGIRNNSIQGHGFFYPKLDKYDAIRVEVTLLINSLLDIDELEYYNECKSVFSLQSKPQLEKHLINIFG